MQLKKRIIILAGLILVGLAWRIYAINLTEYWFDEAFSVLLIDSSWSQMWSYISNDVHPPLYYILLRAWSWFWGITPIGLRSFSILWGVLAIPLTFNLMEKLSKKKQSLSVFVALMVALNPFLIIYSVEVRQYSLIAFLYLLAIWLIVVALQNGKIGHATKEWWGLSAVIASLFLTHYTSIFGIIVLYGIIAVTFWQSKFKIFTKQVFHFALSLTLIPIITIGTWLPIMLYQLAISSELWWVPPSRLSFIPRSMYIFLVGVDSHFLGVPPANIITTFFSITTLEWIVLCIFTTLLGWQFWQAKYKKKLVQKSAKRQMFPCNLWQINFFLLSLWLLPILLVIASAFVGKKIYVERYLMAYGIIFVIHWAFLWETILKKKILLILYACLYLIITWFVFTQPITKYGFAKTAELIATDYIETNIVVDNPGDFIILRSYLAHYNKYNVFLLSLNNEHGYDTWAIIKKTDLITDPLFLPQNNYLIVSKEDLATNLYNQVLQTRGDFILYK